MKNAVPRLAATLACLLLARTSALSAGELVPLGHADFRPTPERPVGFRGDGTGHFPGADPVTSWDEKTGRNVLWKVALPFGYGQPIVVGDRVFTQADPDVLYALDALTGKVLWQSSEKTVSPEEEKQSYTGWFGWHGLSYPAPVCDGKHVYAKSGWSIACYDLQGKPVWKKPTGIAPNTRRPYITQSPLLAGGRIVFYARVARGEFLLGLDPRTGDEVWRTELQHDNGDETNGTATPCVARLPGGDVVLTRSGDVVRAEDGKLLASGLSSPEGYRRFGYGLITFVTSPAHEALVILRKADDREQLHALALNIVASAASGQAAAAPAWGPKLVEACNGIGPVYATQVNHSLFWNGHWYLQGWPDLITLDARDGHTVAWKKAPREMGGHMVWHEYPAPTRAGRCLFTGDRNGVAAVYELDPQWKLLGLSRVAPTWHSGPFFHGDRMYIRVRHALYCLGPKEGTPAAAVPAAKDTPAKTPPGPRS